MGGGEEKGGGGSNPYLSRELNQLPVFLFSLSSRLVPWLEKWAKVFTGEKALFGI